MSSSTHLHFHSHVGQQKPNSIHNRTTTCPFCDRQAIESVLAEDGPILLIPNKFPVLEDTFMTVLVETATCDEDLTTLRKDHLHRLIRFGVENWRKMSQSGEYESVIFYKNHGPYSGGSIHHPHMQIVGLKHIDYREQVADEHFEGHAIQSVPGVDFNISTKPRIGFFEFNVILHDEEQIDVFADFIQVATHYTLNHFNKNCNSYNLFFYEWNGALACKIVPRFVTSPIFVGFSIPQVTDRIVPVTQQIQELYFSSQD